MSDYYGKEYPSAVEAEAWLLSGILQDPKALGEVALILKHGNEFFQEKNQAVWNAIIRLSKEGLPVDVLSVANVLEKEGKLDMVGGKDYIFSLMDSVPSAANIDYYAGIIRDKSILRRLIDDSKQNIVESFDPAAETEIVVNAAESRIFDLVCDNEKERILLFGNVASGFLGTLMARRHDQLSGCPTDFKILDNLTNGLQKTDLIILAARPSMGKTALALNIAANAARLGKTVLFFSLEMNAQQLAVRVLSSLSGVNQTMLRNGKIDTETFKSLQARARELEDERLMPFYIDDSSEVRAFDLLSKCRVFKRKHNNNLDLVVVDYLQMMQISGKSENRAVGVAENSRMLKVLAKTLEVPVLALAQLNRDVEKRPTGGIPQLSDLRDSGSIEQDADMVWFIHRPAKEKLKKRGNDDGEITEEEKREAYLIVAKHRNGPTAKIRLEFHEEFTTFTDYLTTNAQHPDDAAFGGSFP
jgi:replicative DNA helicase